MYFSMELLNSGHVVVMYPKGIVGGPRPVSRALADRGSARSTFLVFVNYL